MSDKKKSSVDVKSDVLSVLVNDDVTTRAGQAVNVHLSAYSGIDHRTGEQLSKGLQSIAESRINPQYKEQNIRQQAGFSAEVKTVALENAENYWNGDTSSMSIRTDDVSQQLTETGAPIGGTNDQLFDVAEVTPDGQFVVGSARQLKYVGGNPEECTRMLLSKGYDKYRENGASLEIPSDYYDEVYSSLQRKEETITRQIQEAKLNGNSSLVRKKQEELKRVSDTRKGLKKGKLTSDEARLARTNPGFSTAVDIAKNANRAGVQAAKSGAAITATISGAQNVVAVLNGDLTGMEAIESTVIQTAKGAASSYVHASVTSVAKGGLQQIALKTNNALVKSTLGSLANSNAVSLAVTFVAETSKSLWKFLNMEITSDEFKTELSTKSVELTASFIGGCIGGAAIPIPVVGELVGSYVGYLCGAAILNAVNTLKSHSQVLENTRYYRDLTLRLQEQKGMFELSAQKALGRKAESFHLAFSSFHEAVLLSDHEKITSSLEMVLREFGSDMHLFTQDEFDDFMESDESWFN